MASKRRSIVEGVIVGGVIGLLGGGGFAGIETVCIAVASTSESSEFCGEGEYGNGELGSGIGLGLDRGAGSEVDGIVRGIGESDA